MCGSATEFDDRKRAMPDATATIHRVGVTQAQPVDLLPIMRKSS